MESFKLVGLKLPHKTTNENNQASTDCGYLWQKFQNEGIFQQVQNKVSNVIFAVYYEYEKDEAKPYSYFIGCKVDETSKAPAGLSELIIPSQEYVKIVARGVMTGCLVDAWKKIWSSEINRKFGFDFEVYDERSQDWNNAEVDIFLSVNGLKKDDNI